MNNIYRNTRKIAPLGDNFFSLLVTERIEMPEVPDSNIDDADSVLGKLTDAAALSRLYFGNIRLRSTKYIAIRINHVGISR